MSSHSNEISQFIERVAKKNSHESEFLQAVEEVA